MNKEVIKCGKCGGKYYKDDIHVCVNPENHEDIIPEIKDTGWVKKSKKK